MSHSFVMGRQDPVDSNKENPCWQWQWQCDPDPFKEKDPAKWTWQNYSQEWCMMIETAFELDQPIATLGDYEIDFKKRLQINRKDRSRIRRVRRQSKESRFMMEIPEPMIVEADEKTMNQAFGTVQHFLEYIMKRTPEAFQLYQRLKGLSLDTKEDEFKEIVKEVISCIRKAAGEREKVIKERYASAKKTHIEKAEELVEEIIHGSKSLRDFLRTILKIYTTESFVCYWLNELLRKDNWTEINILTPYLVCLVYTFKLADYTIQLQTGFLNTMLGYLKGHRLYLYRGGSLTKDQLAQYDPAKTGHFSWNGVTSTSRSLDQALKFIGGSSQPVVKVGVLFVIETDFGSIEDCEGMIDVSKMSKYPSEQEVILAPGTVFQPRKIQFNQKNKYYEGSLKVRKKFDQDEITLLGELQDKAITEKRAIIQGIPSDRSFKILELLKGNQSIQELQIYDSQIEEHVIKMIVDVVASTKLKKQDINLMYNKIFISSLSVLAYYFSPENWTNVILHNYVKFKEAKVEHNFREKDWKLKELRFDGEVLRKFLQQNQFENLWSFIQKEVQLKSLVLSLDNFRISESKLQVIWKSIKYLVSLEIFCLTLKSTAENSTTDFPFLCESIIRWQHLKNLSLNFRNYTPISDENLENLAISISRSLQLLKLDFAFCDKISDRGILALFKEIASLTRLQYLSLYFTRCTKKTDGAFSDWEVNFIHLISLQHLSLRFGGCSKITNQGVKHVFNSIKALRNLKDLSLDFGGCHQISNLGLECLGNALADFPPLQKLSLEFWHCRKISDKGLVSLIKKLNSLQPLTELSLAFGGCIRISSKGIKDLENTLLELRSLKKIDLDFQDCEQISERNFEGLKRTHVNHPDLFFNKRSREDFEPQANREFKVLSEAYKDHRRIFLMVVMLYLLIRIVGLRWIVYIFLVFTVGATVCGGISELKKGGITGFKEDLKKEISQMCDENKRFLTGFIFAGFCFVFWQYGLMYALLALVVLAPVSLVLFFLLMFGIVFIALVLIGFFILAYFLDVNLTKKLNKTVGNSRNQDRVQDVTDTLHTYLNNFLENSEPAQKFLKIFTAIKKSISARL